MTICYRNLNRKTCLLHILYRKNCKTFLPFAVVGVHIAAVEACTEGVRTVAEGMRIVAVEVHTVVEGAEQERRNLRRTAFRSARLPHI